jgi:hypothetical protein
MGAGSGVESLERNKESKELTKSVIKAKEDKVNACEGKKKVERGSERRIERDNRRAFSS